MAVCYPVAMLLRALILTLLPSFSFAQSNCIKAVETVAIKLALFPAKISAFRFVETPDQTELQVVLHSADGGVSYIRVHAETHYSSVPMAGYKPVPERMSEVGQVAKFFKSEVTVSDFNNPEVLLALDVAVPLGF